MTLNGKRVKLYLSIALVALLVTFIHIQLNQLKENINFNTYQIDQIHMDIDGIFKRLD